MNTPSFQIAKPHYAKMKNTTGGLDPCYTFSIITAHHITLHVEDGTDTINLEKAINDNDSYITQLLNCFLTTASQYFVKTYTVDALRKHIKYGITSSENSTEFPCEMTVDPCEIIIFQGKFTLNWKLIHNPIMIRIPDLEEAVLSVSVSAEGKKDSASTDELIQVDDLEEDLRDNPITSDEDISRHYEKRRVKEARLRSKLAQYKAERAMTRYLEKYGDVMSDSESSSEGESEID